MTPTTLTHSRSRLLRDETAVAHQTAENMRFIDQLIAGDLGLGALAALTAQLIPVYAALEETERALRAGAAPSGPLARLLDPGLHRHARLLADFEHLQHRLRADGHAPARTSPLPATIDYVADIRAAAAGDTAAFIGHHYTRYLGDLSGGQVIRSAMRRLHDLDDGLNFYDFSGLGKLKPYKDGYRSALDELDFDSAADARMVAAARRAFAHNTRLFGELGARSATAPDAGGPHR